MSNILINVLRNVICYRNFQYVCGIHVSNKMKWSIFSAPPSIFRLYIWVRNIICIIGLIVTLI